jgi:hypothetical protein
MLLRSEIADPMLQKLMSDQELATLAKERSDTELPSEQKPNTDTLSRPSGKPAKRAQDRMENAEPTEKKSISEEAAFSGARVSSRRLNTESELPARSAERSDNEEPSVTISRTLSDAPPRTYPRNESDEDNRFW